MDSVNTFLSGFKTITTPYDKVDHKARNIQNIINLIGGDGEETETQKPANSENVVPAETPAQANEGAASPPANVEAPPAPANEGAANEGTGTDTAEKTDDTKGSGSSNQNDAEPEENEKGEGIGAFLSKRTLKAAKAGEAERTTELPEGTYIMENIIRIGTVIIYIILLPLIPWYYVMKYSFRKMRHLYDNMFKPM